jgi:hypothetical protein
VAPRHNLQRGVAMLGADRHPRGEGQRDALGLASRPSSGRAANHLPFRRERAVSSSRSPQTASPLEAARPKACKKRCVLRLFTHCEASVSRSHARKVQPEAQPGGGRSLAETLAVEPPRMSEAALSRTPFCGRRSERAGRRHSRSTRSCHLPVLSPHAAPSFCRTTADGPPRRLAGPRGRPGPWYRLHERLRPVRWVPPSAHHAPSSAGGM